MSRSAPVAPTTGVPVLHLTNASGVKLCPFEGGPTAPVDAIPCEGPPLCPSCALVEVAAVAEKASAACGPDRQTPDAKLLRLVVSLATTPPSYHAAVMLIIGDAVAQLDAYVAEMAGGAT